MVRPTPSNLIAVARHDGLYNFLSETLIKGTVGAAGWGFTEREILVNRHTNSNFRKANLVFLRWALLSSFSICSSLFSLSTRICRLYLYVIAVKMVSVQCFYCFVGFGIAWHFNKTVPLRTPGESVFDHFDIFSFSKFFKQRLQFIICCNIR